MRALYFVLLLSVSGCSPAVNELASLASQQFRASGEREESWLHGGKLHFSTALEWQQASFQNKRATSADFLLALEEQGRLAIDISDNERLKVHSEELTKKLNNQFRILGPAVENTSKYENKTVSEAVVVIASENDWLRSV